jgi:hypothetical protein
MYKTNREFRRMWAPIIWVVVGLYSAYQVVNHMYPERLIDKRFQAHVAQVCASMRPRCESVSFKPVWLRGNWQGLQVTAKVAPGSASQVRATYRQTMGPGGQYTSLVIPGERADR